MPEVPTLQIRELEGAQRRLTLRERALPYRRVAFGSTLRHAQTWYAGNPQATLQVLGYSLDDTSFGGMWKARFLPGAVESSGFDGTLETPEALVEAFRSLQRAGALLEVTWGPEQRRGVLAQFQPEWLRVEDVEWQATFVWRDEGRVAPRASAQQQPTEALRAAVVDADDAAGFEPPDVEPEWSDRIFGGLSSARRQVGRVFDAVRQAREQALVPAQAVGNAASSARGLRDTVEETRRELVDVPATYASARDDVAGVLDLESYRRGLGRSSLRLEATGLRTARALARERTPEAVVVEFFAAGTSLRRVAAKYLGDPDAWPRIAEASGLPLRSVLEVASLVTVPPVAPSVRRAVR